MSDNKKVYVTEKQKEEMGALQLIEHGAKFVRNLVLVVLGLCVAAMALGGDKPPLWFFPPVFIIGISADIGKHRVRRDRQALIATIATQQQEADWDGKDS